MNAFGTGAVAGVGVLAAAGPRKRNDVRDKDRRNNDQSNGANNRGERREDRGALHNNATPVDSAGEGCCVLQ